MGTRGPKRMGRHTGSPTQERRPWVPIHRQSQGAQSTLYGQRRRPKPFGRRTLRVRHEVPEDGVVGYREPRDVPVLPKSGVPRIRLQVVFTKRALKSIMSDDNFKTIPDQGGSNKNATRTNVAKNYWVSGIGFDTRAASFCKSRQKMTEPDEKRVFLTHLDRFTCNSQNFNMRKEI